METISQFGWVPYPLYSSNLAPSNFSCSTPCENFVLLRGTKFSNNNEVNSIVNKNLKTQSKDFDPEGIEKLDFPWENSVLKNGDNIKH